jgi:RNA polymerase sigma-70 factor (ECF subfamily)
MTETTATNPTLLERIAHGDKAAVAACIERYSGLVWSLARRFLANNADAEEAVQDVFMELWSNAASFDPARAAEATFVSMLARRRLIDRLRKHRREPERQDLANVEHLLSRDGQSAIEAHAESGRVLHVIEQMEPDQRQVLRMATWLGMTHAKIAEETGLPLGTVKSHLRRGLIRIREQLGIAPESGATR